MQLPSEKKRKIVVLGVDVGTTNIKCFAYDQHANVLGKAGGKLDVILGDGRFEVIPDILWKSFKQVVHNCLVASHLHANEVKCIGISTQRGTFLTWDKDTGQPYHNFISWKDKRADSISHKLNSNFFIKLVRFFCFLFYLFTRMVKFQIFSSLQFSSAMVLTRLYWVLEQFSEVRLKGNSGHVLYGTMDTWLVWKLTGGKVHATDSSNACATGLFDPFTMTWNYWILKYFNIPANILPVVKNTCDSYGKTIPSIFGSSIPISCLVGDQQASTFGACCFEKHSVNCTMGTGSFLSMNTGDKLSASYYNIFPLVGWTINSKTTYIAECFFHETGPYVTWLQNLGLLKNPSESSTVAQSVSDSNGVYFVPVGNLQATDNVAASRLVGVKANSSKEHVVRAVLESLAFQVCLLFDAVNKLCGERAKRNSIRICGGISANDFVVQTVSDLTRRSVHRLKHNETSSLGAAFLAGLHNGVWKTIEEISTLQTQYDSFSPNVNENLESCFRNWNKISKHCL